MTAHIQPTSAPSDDGAYVHNAYEQVGGREYVAPVRIPVWESHSEYGDVNPVLRLSRRMPSGMVEELGTISPDANDWSIIDIGRGKPGTYMLLPLDEHGNKLQEKPYLKNISSDHPGILDYAKRAMQGVAFAGGANGAAIIQAQQGMAPEMLGFIENVVSSKDSQIDDLMQRINAMDTRLSDERKAAADMQLSVAHDHTDQALKTQETLMENDRKRQEAAYKQQAEMMERQRELDQARQALEAKQQSSFYEAMMAQQSTMLAQQRLIGEEREKERRSEEKAREARRKEEQLRDTRAHDEYRERMRESHEKEMERERSHQNSMMKLLTERMEAKDPFAMLDQLSLKAAPLLKAAGIDLTDVLKKVTGGDTAGPTGLIATAADLAKTFMTVQADMARAQMGMVDEQEDPQALLQQAQIQQQIPEGAMLVVGPDGQPVLVADPAYEAQQRASAAFGVAGAQAPASDPVVPEHPVAASHPGPFAVDPGTAHMPPPPPNATVALPPAVAAIDPKVAKRARVALRSLVPQLRALPHDQWLMRIMSTIMIEPTVGEYCMVATVYGAIREAGATEDEANAFLEVAEAHLPPEVPRR